MAETTTASGAGGGEAGAGADALYPDKAAPAAAVPAAEVKPDAETKPAASERTAEQVAADTAEDARRAALTPEARKAEDDAKEAEKVPDGDYEFRGMKEGETVDKEILGLFQPVAKDIGLTQAQFDKLQPVYPQIVAKLAERQMEQYRAQVAGWEATARADKEIGGQKFDENVGHSRAFVKAFGTPELRQALEDSGLGSHPEVLRAFARAGKQLTGEVRTTDTGGGGRAEKTPAEVLYGGTSSS